MSIITKYPDEIRAACRVRYESDPLVTLREVGAELGVTEETLRNWKQAEGWQKIRPDVVLPLPKKAVAIVKREARETGVPVDAGRARMLAMQRYADERSQTAQNIARDVTAINARLNRAIISGNAHDVLLLKQAADAKAKLHSTLMKLWRLNEGPAPVMVERVELDVTPDPAPGKA